MQVELRQLPVLVFCLASLAACSDPQQKAATTWNPKAAAVYLDQREATWIAWPGAARDHDTFCVSCHTVLPYTLSRPMLRRALAEQGPADNERKILVDVEKRVRLWNEVGPYYSGNGYDAKPAESRGTEAVLNALILASEDARNGKLSDLTRTALENMWALQLAQGDGKGAWSWLQFGMEPWEANDSQFYGAALAALTVGVAPSDYHASPEIQGKLELLRDYLTRKSKDQSMMNRVVLLWASAKLPGLLDAAQQKAIIQEILNSQDADGGWELSSHAWPDGSGMHSAVRRRFRSDWTRQTSGSDGYATGLITYVLQQVGMSAQDPNVKRGLAWLASNQSDGDGSWPSSSLTQRRNSSTNVGHFMTDAATSYAVLALSEEDRTAGRNTVGENQSGR